MSFTKANMFNMYFIALISIVALAGTPLYIHHYGIAASEIFLLLFYITATGLSITVGYHRLFAHVTYKTNNLVRFILLFFGAASFQQSALVWASQHREHHKYVDTDKDPYNIKRGFFYAHMGWLFYGDYEFVHSNAGDLTNSKLIMHQARHYMLWSLTAGLITPVLLGALTGHALGALVLSVFFRIVFVHHGTWCINSVCHTFGKSTYDTQTSARDHWLAAFLTFGEGYHSFHHRFPNDYRNGFKWYHWDPTKWTILIFEKLGLAWNLRRASEFRILDARVSAENQMAMDALDKLPKGVHVKNLRERTQERLREQYGALRIKLTNWEHAAKEYYALINERTKPQSLQIQQLRQAFLDEMTQARTAFLQIDRQWRCFTERQIPSLLQA